MPEEPSNWELARGLREIKEALAGVMTVTLWQAYQAGLDQRIADLVREQNASVVRHNSDVEKLERKLAEHSKQSADDKKEIQTRQASQRAAIVLAFVVLFGSFALQFVQIGGGA